MSYLNAGTKSHQLSGMSPQERGNPNEQVDAVLEKRLARELRARHAAQSMEMHELKTIVTRVGMESKVVLMGDTDQVDTPYIDKRSNGLSIVIDKMRNQSVAAHVH